MKKLILLALAAVIMAGCNMAMDSLDVVNGTEYVIKGKRERAYKNDYGYIYNIVKVGGNTWYDYHYKDTADFNVGDTIVITVRRVSN